MSHIAYVNGRYGNQRDAMVHIEDRGYQFSDGVYEYIAFYNKKLLDGDLHLARLERSLKELGIASPMAMGSLAMIIRELIARNSRTHGGIYIQVTRGIAKRDHAFPKSGKPALVVTVSSAKIPKPHEVENGVHIISQPDLRWARRDIKSVSLLANVLAKQEAVKKKAREALLIDGDYVSEGAVSNAYIVNDNGEVVTHPANQIILGGITRDAVLKLARKVNIAVIEKPFTLAEALAAKEAFITSTSINVLPVTRIDDTTIGNGKPGEITKKLLALYLSHVMEQTGWTP